jgi:hypothetical protein
VIYGAEFWTLTNKMGRVLMWESKILGKIYWRTYENCYCRIQVNREICSTFKCPDILTVIKVRRLEWLGHVVRVDGTRTLNELLEGKTGGGRKKRKT